eukprot:115053_1
MKNLLIIFLASLLTCLAWGPKKRSLRKLQDTFIFVEIKTDDYGNDTAWSLENSSGQIIASSPPYSNNIVQTEQVNIDNGTYLFNVTDSAADGLTGNGYYAIYDKGGREILH